jgi:hypothetical protein
MSKATFAHHLSGLTRACRTGIRGSDRRTPTSRSGLSSKPGLGHANRTALNLHGLCGPTLHHQKFLSSLSSSKHTMADLNKFFETVDSLKPEFIQREYLPADLAAKTPSCVEWGYGSVGLTTVAQTQALAKDTTQTSTESVSLRAMAVEMSCSQRLCQ